MGRSLCPHNHHIPSQCFRVRLVLAYRHSNAFISGAGQARSLLCSRKSQADCCFTAQPHMGRGLCLHYHRIPSECPRVRLVLACRHSNALILASLAKPGPHFARERHKLTAASRHSHAWAEVCPYYHRIPSGSSRSALSPRPELQRPHISGAGQARPSLLLENVPS